MNESFFASIHCQSRKKCHICRSMTVPGVEFRLLLAGDESLWDCPFGVTAETITPLTISIPTPIPRKHWPDWAKALADDAHDDDRGVGDTVERRIGPAASMAFKSWYKAIFGAECKCERRKAEWNALYPYTAAQPS